MYRKMYSKRTSKRTSKHTSKLLDLSVSRFTADVDLRDLMCPVCRGILIEPVTLPCTHNFCLHCFEGTFEHNSLTCPLCRMRVGSWLRNATKSKTLVNHDLWELIRTKFPKEVENKHNGEEVDFSLDADYATNRILSAPGEIHKEYEELLQMEEEMCREKQVVQITSEVLIQKLQAEEHSVMDQLTQDKLLAKTLAKQKVAETQKEAANHYKECLIIPSYPYFNTSRFNTAPVNFQTPQIKTTRLERRRCMSLPEFVKDSSNSRQMNMALLSAIETICSNIYANIYVVPEPPLPTYIKSCSACEDRIRQDAKEEQAVHNLDTSKIINKMSLDYSPMVSETGLAVSATEDAKEDDDTTGSNCFDEVIETIAKRVKRKKETTHHGRQESKSKSKRAARPRRKALPDEGPVKTEKCDPHDICASKQVCEDFELAHRLQIQFDKMEQVARRTRSARKATKMEFME